MRKYYAIIFLLSLFTVAVVAQTEENEQANQEGDLRNPIISFISTLDPNNVHLRSIIEDYLYGDSTDRTIDPAVVTEDFLSVLGRVDSRLFSLSKKTMFDYLLHDTIVAATKNVNALDAKRVAKIADDILQHNNDVLILEKSVGLYAAAVAQLNDEDVAHTFARTTIFMLRRIIFSSDQYTPARLITTAVPQVTEIVNKKIAADTSFVSAILNIFDEIGVPDAYKTVRKLFSKIVIVGVS